MAAAGPAAWSEDLHRYLTRAREALVWKLDGLGEYDLRRPLLPTGTNLLGLVKHCAANELRYLGECFDRPLSGAPDWLADEGDADLWATPKESRGEIVALYRRAWEHADATVAALPPEATGRVPWWPAERGTPMLRTVLVHVLAETTRHAGHADIVRELIDGEVGARAERRALVQTESAAQRVHYREVERAARAAAGGTVDPATGTAPGDGSTDVTVRTACATDLEEVVTNLWAVAAEGRWLGAETPFDRDARRERFAGLLPGEGGTLLVAEHPADGLVGHVSVDLAPYGVASIGMLVVDGQRGRGIGTALLAAARIWAVTAGAHKLALEVWPDNRPAVALYERAGFRHEGRKVGHYRRRSGELWDSLLMGLPL